MSDNRKTFRLEERTQEILTDYKDNRGITENEAANKIIQLMPDQSRKITQQHEEILKLQTLLYDEQKKVLNQESELNRIKTGLLLFGNLIGVSVDSKPAPDQGSAGAGQANS